ncbi:type VI secretion system protein TssA [Siculibacillus lacustris]|nr:type VI secretion system ImpA family N-terminal domain-containing protein [Siculibacillus lacustris]
MAKVDVASFLEPVSDDEPCGPDLDLAGDPEFMNYTARAEGLLPQSFFAFDRASIDYKSEFATIEGLLDRTRDLRLLVLYAKLAILGRDLDRFCDALEVIVAALDGRWAEVHPQGEGSDYLYRVATLTALDDGPHTILPLQYAPIVNSRRTGPLGWRACQVAAGKIPAREGEPAVEQGAIERAFLEAELPALIDRRDRYARIVAAADAIDALTIEKGDYDNRVHLEKMRAQAQEITEFLDGYVARRDPSAALSPAEGTPDTGDDSDDPSASGAPASFGGVAVAGGPSPGAVATVVDRRSALRALAAAADYFQRHEPSSPALLLLRYAQKVSNQPFAEVVRTLLPDYAAKAYLKVGQSSLAIMLDKLSEATAEGWEAEPEPEPEEGAEEGPDFTVGNRRDALRLLDLVQMFFRTAEPGSAVPVLIARARELAERDFVSLMKDFFSDAMLQSMKGDDW